jgi:hypothetical protein
MPGGRASVWSAVALAPLSGRPAFQIPHGQRFLFLNSFWDGRPGQGAFEFLPPLKHGWNTDFSKPVGLASL